jgi:hypothetical protein
MILIVELTNIILIPRLYVLHQMIMTKYVKENLSENLKMNLNLEMI